MNPGYTVGWVEQLINNLQLNFSVYYAGADIYQVWRSVVASALKANQNALISQPEVKCSTRSPRLTVLMPTDFA